MKISARYMIPLLTLILILLPLGASNLSDNKAQNTSPNITTNCSSPNCLSCLNSFTCETCLYDDIYCCPLYCSACINMNHCFACNSAFALKSLSNGSIICARIFINTDPNWNTSINSCIAGYFLEPYTNSCTGCGIQNCQTCTGFMACTTCPGGYYLANGYQTNYFNYCRPCGYGCQNCQNELTCNTCFPRYGLNGATCVHCVDQYCLSCSSNGLGCNFASCQSIAYNTANSQPCQLCSTTSPGCNSCNFLLGIGFGCLECQPGFYVYDSFFQEGQDCLPCQKNCQSCYLQYGTPLIVCTSCFDGFYFLQNSFTGECLPCSAGCLKCSNSNTCQSCMQSYYFNSSGNSSSCLFCQYPCLYCSINSLVSNQPICSKCYPGFYIVSTSQQTQCLYCNISNCVNCNSSTFCTQCQTGYFTVFSSVNGSQICQICPSGCLQCQANLSSGVSELACMQCTLGNYLTQSSCVSCNITNCNYCQLTVIKSQQIPTCLECATGFMLVANNSQNIPQPPYICKSCSIQNCQICNETYTNQNSSWTVSNPFCLDCVDGFYLSSSTTCAQCPTNCIECTSPSFCLVCSANYFIVFQSNISQICQKCPVQCLYCTSQGCLACAVGYYHEPRIGFEPNMIYECFSCSVMPGCAQCQFQNWCTLCFTTGYALYPNTFGQCIACGDSCIKCDQNLVCSQCDVGYQLIVQINQCQQVSGIPIWAFFSTCTLGFMIAFVIIEKLIRQMRNCIKSKKSKKDQNSKISDEETKRVLEEDGASKKSEKNGRKGQESLIESEQQK